MTNNPSESDDQIETVTGSIHPDQDVLQDMRAILEPSRLILLQQILATNWASLSAPELAARNPDRTESTIRDHLREMATKERPFVEKLSADTRAKGVPWTYYAVTDYGIELLKRTGFYDQISLLHQAYAVAERSERIAAIEAFEHRPTPDYL